MRVDWTKITTAIIELALDSTTREVLRLRHDIEQLEAKLEDRREVLDDLRDRVEDQG